MALRDLTPWRANPARMPARFGTDDPFRSLRHEMDRMFDDFFGGLSLPDWGREEGGMLLMPHLDVRETDKAYAVSVEIPGVDEKDLEVTLAEGVLTVQGEKKAESKDEAEGRLHVERSFGRFQRSLALPADADAEAVDAAFKNGVLTITVGKRPEAKKAHRKIAIKSK